VSVQDGFIPPGADEWPPDPLRHPEFYDGITIRRVAAFILDWAIIGMLLIVLHMVAGMLTILTFGLLAFLHILLLPIIVALVYQTVQFAAPGAGTLGMRLFGLRAWSLLGGRPTTAQSVIHAFCLYGSFAVTAGLIMLVALFDGRRRTLHDMLSGIILLREI
jgi:uncharacterized RDD family membrane protein YckC